MTPRFADQDYRHEQVYVGVAVDRVQQVIHFVAPKPEDVPALMEGLLALYQELEGTEIDPVVLAAVVSFGFVFIHPFDDGNGRIHRFLIHYVLARTGVVPEGTIIPVSAIMVQRPREYDACLETFSRPLMHRVDYDLTPDGRMTVKNDTVDHYRYIDATRMVVDLYRWLFDAVDLEMKKELDFLQR